MLDFFKPTGKSKEDRLEKVFFEGKEKLLFKNNSGSAASNDNTLMRQQKIADEFLGVSRINTVGAPLRETLKKRKLSDQAVEIWKSQNSLNENSSILSIISELNPSITPQVSRIIKEDGKVGSMNLIDQLIRTGGKAKKAKANSTQAREKKKKKSCSSEEENVEDDEEHDRDNEEISGEDNESEEEENRDDLSETSIQELERIDGGTKCLKGNV